MFSVFIIICLYSFLNNPLIVCGIIQKNSLSIHRYCIVINQSASNLLNIFFISYFESIHFIIINFTNTNIEQSDYDAKVKAIVYTLSQNKSSVTDFYIPYGDKSGDDYIIDDNSWNSAKKALGTG